MRKSTRPMTRVSHYSEGVLVEGFLCTEGAVQKVHRCNLLDFCMYISNATYTV